MDSTTVLHKWWNCCCHGALEALKASLLPLKADWRKLKRVLCLEEELEKALQWVVCHYLEEGTWCCNLEEVVRLSRWVQDFPHHLCWANVEVQCHVLTERSRFVQVTFLRIQEVAEHDNHRVRGLLQAAYASPRWILSKTALALNPKELD